MEKQDKGGNQEAAPVETATDPPVIMRRQPDGSIIIDSDFKLESVLMTLGALSFFVAAAMLLAWVFDDTSPWGIALTGSASILFFVLRGRVQEFYRLSPEGGRLRFEQHVFGMRRIGTEVALRGAVFLGLQVRLGGSRGRGFYWRYRPCLCLQEGRMVHFGHYDSDLAAMQACLESLRDCLKVPIREVPLEREWGPVELPVTMTSALDGPDRAEAAAKYVSRSVTRVILMTVVFFGVVGPLLAASNC